MRIKYKRKYRIPMNEQNGLYGKSMQSTDYLVPLNTPMRSISIGFVIYLREIVAVFFLSLFWRGVVEWEACPTYIYILSFCPKNNQTKAWKRQKRVCQLYHSSPNKHVEKSTVIPDKERGCRRDSEVIRVGPAACCCCLISGMALTGDSLILDYYV